MLPLDRTTFEAALDAAPEAWREPRQRAWQVFQKLAMPDPKEEDWRYVELDVDLADFRLVVEPGSPVDDDGLTGRLGALAGSATIVDGHTVAVASDGPADLVPLETVSAGSAASSEADIFAAAHDAFGVGGVHLRVPAGRAIEEPFFVDVHATTEGSVTFPRVVVQAEDGSQSSIVVRFRSPDGVGLLTVPRIEVEAGRNARSLVTIVQQWGDATTAIGHARLRADADATVELDEAGIGGEFARLHLTVDLVGRGADARILGVSFGDNHQTHDYRYFMNHAAPNTTSEMSLKGAVGDDARSVFTGMIRIEPEGQKTNAHQTNRNLVLSEGAEAHSVPNLEILANDVRCGHGSAVGPLDEEQRYYLMSRGLDRGRADRLQVKGFFEEVLARFPVAALEEPLRKRIMAKYDGVAAREAS